MVGQREMVLNSRLGASQRELEQAAQSGCGYSILRGVQGQVGWDPGPDLEASGTACGRGVGTW